MLSTSSWGLPPCILFIFGVGFDIFSISSTGHFFPFIVFCVFSVFYYFFQQFLKQPRFLFKHEFFRLLSQNVSFRMGGWLGVGMCVLVVEVVVVC